MQNFCRNVYKFLNLIEDSQQDLAHHIYHCPNRQDDFGYILDLIQAALLLYLV